MAVEVHPTAIVDPDARLGVDVFIGPFCRIGPSVEIGDRCRLRSHVVIECHTSLGARNVLHPFCVFGGDPQDKSYNLEPTRLEIGEDNVFREGVTVTRGTAKDRALTTIGSHNYLMAQTHVGHDCVVGNYVIMANQSALAGHVVVDDFANIGGLVGITQRVRIGRLAFVGANTVLRKDLPPYLAAKEFSQVTGPNLVGLKRAGVSEENVRVARELFKTLYLNHWTTEKAMAEIANQFGSNPFAQTFITFVNNTKIGIQR